MKNIKKLTSVMLIFALLVSMGISAMAVPSYTFDTKTEIGLVPVREVLFSESFDGSDTTSSVLGSQSANPLSVISRVGSSTDGTKNFLWINNVSESNKAATPYYTLKSENALKGEYVIEFKFNKTQNHTTNIGQETDIMFFGAGYTDGVDKKFAVKLAIDKNDKPYYIDNSGTKKYFINDTEHAWTAGFNLNSYWTWDEGDWYQKAISGVTSDMAKSTADWYVVKVKVNTDKETYRVYLNGALVIKDEAFIGESGTSWSECGINIPYSMEYDCNVGVRYVYDDLRIYREVSGYDSIYANNFNLYPDGTTWVGHTASANLTGVAELGLSVFGGKGSNLKINGGKLFTEQSGAGAVVDSFIAEDSIVIEGEVNVPAFTSTEEKIYAPIITLCGASNGGGIRIGVNQNGEIYSSWFHELVNLTKLGTMTLGTAHKFLLYADFKELTASLYIDDVLVAKNIGLGRNTNTANGIANGNGFAIGLGYHKEAPQVAVSYDDLRVYKDERETAFLKIADVVPEELEEITSLPTIIQNIGEYTVSWSSDDVEVENNIVKLKRDDANKTVGLKATVTDKNGEYSVTHTFTAKTPKIIWSDDAIYQKSYLNENGEYITTPEETAKVTVTVSDKYDYIPVLAKYSNGKMVGIDVGINKKTVEMEKMNGWGDVKFMLWEKGNSLKPVSKSEDISTSGNLLFPDAKNVVLSGAFSDSMVLQRDSDIKVWGYAGDEDFTKVSVSLGENSAVAYVKDGFWEAALAPMEATTEPQTLKVQGDNSSIVLNDILIGDVYFVGGQSNSEYRVDRTDTYADDKASFKEEDNIRIFYQTSSKKAEVQLDPPDGTMWEPLTESTMGKFSAIGCYFAKQITETEKNVPIGLIQTSLGGTWLHEHLPLSIADKYEFAKTQGNRSQVYNALTAPVEKFSAKGLIWYQGENESISSIIDSSTAVYKQMFSDYITYLKNVTGSNLKVFLVQLSSHTNTTLLNWNVPRMRAFQYDMANDFDHEIYMVPSLDQGVREKDLEGVTDDRQIQSIIAHPRYKKALGERLGNIALKTIYNKDDIQPFAPEYKNIEYNSDNVKITFENVGEGLSLASDSGETLLGFELTKDGVAYPATATIVGNDTVVLTGVTDATGVRYAFYMSAPKIAANLINSEGLPCPTFAAGDNAIKIDALSRGLME